MGKHRLSKPKSKTPKHILNIIKIECKKEIDRNIKSTAEEIAQNIRSKLFWNRDSLLRDVDQTLKKLRKNNREYVEEGSEGSDSDNTNTTFDDCDSVRNVELEEVVSSDNKLEEKYVKKVESSNGSGLNYDNNTTCDDSDSDSDGVSDVTKDMPRESYKKISGMKKSGTGSSNSKSNTAVSAEEREVDTVYYNKNGATLEKGIGVDRKSEYGSIKKKLKRHHSTDDETSGDTFVNKRKAKMARPEKIVELEEAVTNVKNQQMGVHLRSNKQGRIEDVKNGGPMFKDFGGMSEIVDKLKSDIIFPLFHPEVLRILGIDPIKGILLKGPPGCGKSNLARAIANEAEIPFYMISGTELVSGVSGASEENIRELFAKAYRTAPSVVFIDEIDAIGSKRENQQRSMERRIVTQLMTCMDESHKPVQSSNSDPNTSQKSDYVLVIGATNRPDDLDAALRRPGRFDREITLRAPDERARLEILSVLITNRRVEGSLDLAKIARSTHAFVGADLKALVDEAGRLAIKRITDRRKSDLAALVNKAGNLAIKRNIDRRMSDCCQDWCKPPLSTEETETISITMADLEEAAKVVQTSFTREGFSSIPNVKWEDVGGLPGLRKEFDRYIIKPIKNPAIYANVDLDFGFLLYGPPGCGKTLIAMAVANESGVNFIHIKAAELLNKYVGESERAVRTLFSRARTCSPCILFFDEVDALSANGDTEGGGVVSRLLRQLMIELSGSVDRRNVFIIGATNRPEVMDRALFRNGRFGQLMHVTLPNAEERGSILTALARKKKIDDSVNLIAFGRDKACKNLSGSDLSKLLNNAGMLAAQEGYAAFVNAIEGAGKDLSGTDISKLLNNDVIDAVDRRGAESSSCAAWPIKLKHLQLALKEIEGPKTVVVGSLWYGAYPSLFRAAISRARDLSASSPSCRDISGKGRGVELFVCVCVSDRGKGSGN